MWKHFVSHGLIKVGSFYYSIFFKHIVNKAMCTRSFSEISHVQFTVKKNNMYISEYVLMNLIHIID